jgi:hypothetical protein
MLIAAEIYLLKVLQYDVNRSRNLPVKGIIKQILRGADQD